MQIGEQAHEGQRAVINVFAPVQATITNLAQSVVCHNIAMASTLQPVAVHVEIGGENNVNSPGANDNGLTKSVCALGGTETLPAQITRRCADAEVLALAQIRSAPLQKLIDRADG